MAVRACSGASKRHGQEGKSLDDGVAVLHGMQRLACGRQAGPLCPSDVGVRDARRGAARCVRFPSMSSAQGCAICVEICPRPTPYCTFTSRPPPPLTCAPEAVLAVPPPKRVLSSKHAELAHVSAWWDEYYDFGAPLYDMDRTCCLSGLNRAVMDNPRFISELPGIARKGFWNRSLPLCLSLEFGYYGLRWKAPQEARLTYGPPNASTSLALGAAAKRIYNAVVAVDRLLSLPFNAVHVQRGDKGRRDCTGAKNVVSRMAQAQAGAAGSPWLVVSNAEPAWWEDFLESVESAGIKVVTELQLSQVYPLAQVKDNYMRYAVLKALYRQAVVKIGSYQGADKLC